MGADQGVRGFIDRVEAIERANPELRVVAVSMPCDFTEQYWNVDDPRLVNTVKVNLGNIPGMRGGIYGAYRVTKGPFSVRFNDGSTA